MTFRIIHIAWTGIRLSILVLACFNLFPSNTIAVESPLLKTIQSFDTVYGKGVTSSGNHIETRASRLSGGEQIIDEEWAFTQSEYQKAVLKTARLVPQSIGEGIGAPPHRTVFLADQRRLGMKSVDLLPDVSPPDYATSQDVVFASLDLFAPDSNTLSYRLGLFLIAMGRGVANKIDVLDAVNKSVDWNGEECVMIEGQGKCFMFPEARGVWKVHVLPNAAYMVRHAQYLYDGVVRIEVETFGLNYKNDCYYPEKSEIRILRGNPFNTNHKFVFSDARLKFDPNLFERVTQDIDAEMPKDSEIKDRSSGELKVRLVGGEEPRESYELQPRPFFSARTIFIIIFNLVGIALLIYLYYRSRRINQS